MPFVAIVTGAAGFIGSHLVDFLLKRDDVLHVVGIDNFCCYSGMDLEDTLDLKLRNLQSAMTYSSFELLKRDILRIDITLLCNNLTRTKQAPCIIFHLAASAGVRPSIKDPKGYATNNVEATTHLLEGAVRADVYAFVMASSSSVYGNHPPEPSSVENGKPKAFRETDHTDLPISPYAATKKATELMAYSFFANHKLPVACMRLFSVYGPRQRPDLAIHKFMRHIINGDPIDIYGDGSMERDYTYVGDVVESLWAAGQRIRDFGYKIWNIGNSAPIKLLPLVNTIEKVVGLTRPHPLNFLPVPHGDVARTCADVSEASADLGYTPSYALDDGLKAEWDWMRRLVTT
jgi:UDP-glucuronate 4-epimerase